MVIKLQEKEAAKPVIFSLRLCFNIFSLLQHWIFLRMGQSPAVFVATKAGEKKSGWDVSSCICGD